MSHPSVFFIKFLLAESWGADEPQNLSTVNATLRNMRLLPLGESAYDEIVLALEPPPDFAFDDRQHEASREFMRAEKISTLWTSKHKDDERVLEVLMPLGLIRSRVDILLMGNVNSEFIARVASQWATALPHVRWDGVISPRMIDYYRHFFMNPWTCDLGEWETLLRGHPMEEGMLAALQGGPSIARYWAGLPLKLKNKKAPLEDALMAAHMRLETLRHKPTTKAVIDMQVKLSQTIERLHERLYGDAADSAADQLMEFSRHIKLVTRDTGIKSIHELVGPTGSYSGDGSAAESA